jgi:uncharacterized protein with PIN domain
VPTILLDFQNGLVDLVRAGRHGRAGPRLSRTVPEIPSLKDAVEAAGVPHVEVGRVTGRGGRSLGLDDPVPTDETVAVWPVAPYRLEPARFVCDQHLGKLARLLRLMGFDTVWNVAATEPELARRSVNEGRTLLSRGRAVLMRSAVVSGQFVRSSVADDQAVEVVRRFRLAGRIQLFGRCSLCNGRLEAVAKAQVAARIPPRTARWLDAYHLCQSCDQLYWEGTHVERLRRRLAAVVARAGSRADGEPTP